MQLRPRGRLLKQTIRASASYSATVCDGTLGFQRPPPHLDVEESLR
jgi:hypothetical protein